MPTEACNFAKVFQAEGVEIAKQCHARGVEPDLCVDDKPGSPIPDRLGIAFSGGGVRSASVGLGIAQRLAKSGILRQAHYLSGISGGTYLLSWLTVWIKRSQSFSTVERALGFKASPSTNHTAETTAEPAAVQRFLEPEPLHFLRRYIAYLTPRLGLLSGDTLAAISIYLRNVLLNQTMLSAGLISLTMLLQLLSPTIAWSNPAGMPWLWVDLSVILILFIFAIAWIMQSLKNLTPDPKSKHSKTIATQAIACGAVICVMIWFLLPAWYAQYPTQRWTPLAVLVFVIAGFLITAPFTKERRTTAVERSRKTGIPTYLLAWTICGALACAIDEGFRYWLLSASNVEIGTDYVVFGLGLLMLGLVGLSFVFVGILGDALPDSRREWIARFAGYFILFSVATMTLLAVELYGPMVVHVLFSGFRQPSWQKRLMAAVIPGGWLFVVVSGLLAGNSSKTSGDNSSSGTLERLVVLAPPVFLVGILLLSAWGTHALAVRVITYGTSASQSAVEYLDTADWFPPLAPTICSLCLHPVSTTYSVSITDEHNSATYPEKSTRNSGSCWWHRRRAWYLLVWLATTLIAVVLAVRLDVNEFSMNLFYRNRLVRTFLGASNAVRRPSPFTGFALDDDIPLQALTLAESFEGPYPIWGTTLNITAGEDLAWQQRKGASFIYSPLFCGWDYVNPKAKLAQPELPATDPDRIALERKPPANLYGYRSTLANLETSDPGYGGFGGKPYIGTAMAASGAAASPNMGYHTSPAVAALLAIFNVRLGWWTGNPRNPTYWKEYAPAIWYLLAELFAHATDRDRYVYLSDGGHFENLGIYELVRRRVRFIICSDADADPSFRFEDLGNAVEHCRADFGVEIRILAQQNLELSDTSPFRRAHYAVGEIAYPDSSAKGILLYIKSSLTDDEPADVLGMRAADAAFPHDTTANQFFDESKFEAYRALGEHMMDIVLKRYRIEDTGENSKRNVLQLYKALSSEMRPGDRSKVC